MKKRELRSAEPVGKDLASSCYELDGDFFKFLLYGFWPFVDALGCNKHADATAIIAVINATCVCTVEGKV